MGKSIDLNGTMKMKSLDTQAKQHMGTSVKILIDILITV